MSASVRKALIIGGGFSGMAAAIELRKLDIAVELVELDPSWSCYGAGITISGPSLRALDALGVLPEFLARGACADGVDLFTAGGDFIATLPTPRIVRADVPGGGAILRPVLASILAEATGVLGAEVRLGVSFESLDITPDHVDVEFTDGSRGRYDLVIGADGLYSKTRQTLFPDAPAPRYTGQGVWRALAPRGPVERPAMFLGPQVKVGYSPVSAQQMYLFVTEDRPAKAHVSDGEALPALRALLAGFDAPELRPLKASLGEDSAIMFRPLEGLLMPQPWARGRVLLIGDTVHATTPHLASGAGIGIEDALVLAAELARTESLELALERYQARRWERCRLVVENSLRLGDIELSGGSKRQHAELMRDSMLALLEPI